MTFRFVVPDDGEKNLSGKQTVLLRRLRSDYNEQIIRNVLIPLIEKSAPISLRALDWLVVNEAKRQSLVCSSTHAGVQTNIFKSYQESLKFWKRRLFDPFRRKYPLEVHLDGRVHLTTLGQSNFVLFVHETGIMSYGVFHLAEIEQSMNEVVQRQKQDRVKMQETQEKRSRTELTKSISPPCVVYKSTARIRM